MFVVTLTYKVDLSIIDAHRKEHLDWLQRGYDAGVFLASGRQVPVDGPVTGGVILAHGITRADLDVLLKTDPFLIHHLADAAITEFAPKMVAKGLEFLVMEG